MKPELTEEIEFFIEKAKSEITISRFEHSLKVAQIAYEIATIHNFHNPLSAYLAGVLHDFTKQKTNSFHIDVFNRNQFDYSDLPTPAYHAFSAYFVLQELFQFKNLEILNAIKNHTLGGVELDLLSKILYVSDFLGSEYAEKNGDYSEWVRLSKDNLTYGMILKSSKTIQDLTEKKFPIHPITISLYNESVKIFNT